MRLYLFSKIPLNNKKTEVFYDLLKNIKKNKFKVSVVCFEEELSLIQNRLDFFKSLKININLIKIDKEPKIKCLNDIEECDIIYAYTRQSLKFSKKLNEVFNKEVLNKLIKSEKILICEDAASSVACNEFCLYEENSIENIMKQGIGMASFSFIPNWEENSKWLYKIMDLSKFRNKTFYCCSEECAIVLDSNSTEFYGDVIEVNRGKTSIYNGVRRIS